VDNDLDGTVDDGPVDCWSCDYQSSAYSPAAVTCDGLDSDCDGMSDEDCICTTGQSKLYVVEHGTTSRHYLEKNSDRVQRTNLDRTGVKTVLDVEGSDPGCLRGRNCLRFPVKFRPWLDLWSR
jgi:hypothetical protein